MAKELDPNAGMFFTDLWLAEKIVAWAGIGGLDVLEPNAGDGSFVQALLTADPKPKSVTAVEYLREFADRLKNPKVKTIPYSVSCEDFLQHHGRYDVAIMNPPYEENRDGLHVEHALKLCNRVVALVRANFPFSVDRQRMVYEKAWVRRRRVLYTRPKFHGPGDKGHTARHDYEILEFIPNEIVGDDVGMVETEYWRGRKLVREPK